MNRLVSNATPLIYLAKANQLALLRDIIRETLIPEAVYREVVTRGKSLQEKDAFRVEKAVSEGWIVVKGVNQLHRTEIPIHRGELEVISLAKEAGVQTVLIDDTKARLASELAGLQPRGTLWLILQAVKHHKLNFDEFLTTLESITEAGFYLKEELYLKAIQAARTLLQKSASSAPSA